MLYVVHPNEWRADFLGAVYSGGEAPIDPSDFVEGVDGIWQPGSFVSLYHLLGDDWLYDDAPWWDLPAELLGRGIHYCVGADAVPKAMARVSTDPQEGRPFSGKAFVKLAKHKYSHFVAAVVDGDEFADRRAAVPAIRDHDFIVSGIVDVVEECRHWFIGEAVVHSGVYVSGDWRWSGGPSPVPVDSGHVAVARDAATALGLGSAVIDTGRLADGRIVVIEANPPWSSGFYDAPAEVVREATLLSQGRSPRRHQFEPDLAAATGLRRHRWLSQLT